MKSDESDLPEQQEVYEFEGFRLDAGRRLVFRGTDALSVTSRAFDVLLYLVRHQGQLVSKRELLDAVWGDVVVEENNLTQAISVLRRVLGEEPGEHRFIATVSGRGYRFTASVTSPNGSVAADDGTGTPPSQPVARPSDGPGKPLPFPATARSRLWIWLPVAAVAMGGLVALLWLTAADPDPPDQVIAVLPFRPLVAQSGDPALELGMADTLITLLESRGVVVRPLSSVRGFGAPDQDARSAGRDLDVDAVLDGSIHRDAETLRVNVRLLRVRDGSTLWAERLDLPWTSLFGMQDTIAERIADVLAIKLTGDQPLRPATRFTDHPEAYRLYQLGRYHVYRLTPPEIDRGITYLDRAIELDPNYALAHAALAEAHRALAITSDRPPASVLPLGKAAAQRALELDPTLDQALATLCFIQIWWDWDWPAAEASCKRALDLNPHSADAHRAYAVLLSNLGQHERAVAAARRSTELDPLALITNAIEAHVLHYAGRDEEALARLRATLELDPHFWIAHLFMGKVLLDQGHHEEALARFQQAHQLAPGASEPVSLIGCTQAMDGDRDGALQTLETLLEPEPGRYVPPYNIAMVYGGLRDRDRTLEWLERAYAERDVRLTFLGIERKWGWLRGDDQFRALAQRMGLTSSEPAMAPSNGR